MRSTTMRSTSMRSTTTSGRADSRRPPAAENVDRNPIQVHEISLIPSFCDPRLSSGVAGRVGASSFDTESTLLSDTQSGRENCP
jgi:hypothetical protein